MKQNLLLRTAIIGGVAIGLLWLFISVALQHFGFKPLGRHLFLSMPVYAAGMMLVMTWYRNYRNNHVLQGSHALAMAFVINFIATLFYATSLYLFLRFVSDEMLQAHHKDILQLLVDNKDIFIKDTGKEVYEQKLASASQISPAIIATDVMIKTSISGFFVAFIIALGLRKTP
jgi:hypothetical protein